MILFLIADKILPNNFRMETKIVNPQIIGISTGSIS